MSTLLSLMFLGAILFPFTTASPLSSFIKLPKGIAFNSNQTVISNQGLVYVYNGGSIGEWKALVDSQAQPIKAVKMICSPAYCFFIGQQNTSSIYYTPKTSGSDVPSVNLLSIPEPYNTLSVQILNFHPTQRDWLIFNGMKGICTGTSSTSPESACFTVSYASKDLGVSWKPVSSWTLKCNWAQLTTSALHPDDIYCSEFTRKHGDKSMDVLIKELERGNPSNPISFSLYSWTADSSLLDKSPRILLPSGVLDYHIMESQLIIANSANGSKGISVSTNGVDVVPAHFSPPIDLNKCKFTLLDSNANALFVDVAVSGEYNQERGNLYLSRGIINGDSSATKFQQILPSTNLQPSGFVDFVRSWHFPGLLLANVFDPLPSMSKRVVTKLSWDNGARWSELKDSNTQFPLHLHLKSVHVLPQAPNLLIGVGNVGSSLLPYLECDLYASLNAGHDWRKIHSEASLWALSEDSSTLMVINDETLVNSLSYSFDFGTTWLDYQFIPDTQTKIRVDKLISFGDTTFLIYAHAVEGPSLTGVAYSFNFAPMIPKECASGDLESWFPLADQHSCVFGSRVQGLRRKGSLSCRMKHESIQKVSIEPCTCSNADFMCDFGFIENQSGGCEWDKVSTICDPETNLQSSGFVKIPLNPCVNGVNRVASVPCALNTTSPSIPQDPNNVAVNHRLFASPLAEFKIISEWLLMRDASGRVWSSGNFGLTWEESPFNKENTFLDIVVNDHQVFLVSSSRVFVSNDQAYTWRTVNLPATPASATLVDRILQPHPTQKDWLLFVGMQDCAFDGVYCQAVAFISKNSGSSWSLFASYVSSCAWSRSSPTFSPSLANDSIVCLKYNTDSGNQLSDRNKWTQKLVFFAHPADPYLTSFPVVTSQAFAIMDEFIISTDMGKESSELSVSLNGKDWAVAEFSIESAKASHEAYTAIDSSNGHLLISVLSDSRVGAERGVLFKSDWNGTHLRPVLQAINQDSAGYVDFETVAPFHGFLIANTVQNVDQVPDSPKQLRTVMSMDDGESWDPLPKPVLLKDSVQPCNFADASCSLHLHAYTQRKDRRDLYTSAGMPGLLIGNGMVGTVLPVFSSSSVFLSRDAGASWYEVLKGPHMHETAHYGDVIIFVKDDEPIDYFSFTLDQGISFQSRKFDLDGKLQVSNMFVTESTDPSIIDVGVFVYGQAVGGSLDKQYVLLSLNFTSVVSSMLACVKKDDDESVSDYERWHVTPDGSQCLLGETLSYIRRKRDRQCRSVGGPEKLATPCECSYVDFECEAGYIRQKDGSCTLPPGMQNAPDFPCISGMRRQSHGYRKFKHDKCLNKNPIFDASEVACQSDDSDAKDWSKFAGIPAHLPPHSSVSSYYWILFTAITVLTIFYFGYRDIEVRKGGRYGHIQLPLYAGDYQEDVPRSPLSRAKLYFGVGSRLAFYAMLDGVEYLTDAGVKAYRWIRALSFSGRHYTPIPVFFNPSQEEFCTEGRRGEAGDVIDIGALHRAHDEELDPDEQERTRLV